jgi:urease accessory protein
MHVTKVFAAGGWNTEREVGRVVLDFDERFRRRVLLRTTDGADVHLDLANAVRLRDGDGLCLADGGVIRVVAKPEALLEITAAFPQDLARLAWHLGNRHWPVQFCGERIRIRADHVIAGMVLGLGGKVTELQAPFDPEAGAYASAGEHHHGGNTHGH